MIFDALGDLNWVAVLVATIAWFIFSAIWYSVPPISKPWMRAVGLNESDTQGPPLPPILAATIVLYFVTTVVIALLARATGASNVGDGLALGAALGIGFGLVSALISQLYERKGSSYWVINGINALVAWSIVAVIVTVWD